MAETEAQKRIAVVGSGLTGLAAAWILGDHHDITLIERAPSLGMAAYGVPIPMVDGSVANIDVPLRVLTTSYYHFLFELYADAGIPVQGEDYSISFSHVAGKGSAQVGTTYWHNTLLRLLGYSTPVPKMNSVESIQATTAFARLLHLCKNSAGAANLSRVSFGQWMQDCGVPQWDQDHVVLPLLSVILTCDHQDILQYPASIVIDYMGAGSGESVRRAVGGSTTVCERLARKATVQVNAKIAQVIPNLSGGPVQVVYEDGSTVEFDAVVLATQANVAGRLLGQAAPPDLQRALGSFGYCKTHIVCHTDRTVMPGDRKHWRVVSFGVNPGQPRSMATIHMNALIPDMRMSPAQAGQVAASFRQQVKQGAHDWDAEGEEATSALAAGTAAAVPAAEAVPSYVSTREDGTVDVFQTLNPLVMPHPASIMSESWVDRPIMTLDSIDAFEAIERAQGAGGVYICGSYAVHGMPLLEGAVESAVKACRQLGVEPPFWQAAVAKQAARHEAVAVPVPGYGRVKLAVCLPGLQVVVAVLLLLFVLVAAWFVGPESAE